MSDLRHFELLEDLRPFESAKAILLRWNGARYITTGEEIQVVDFIGTHGHRKDRGYTRFIPESDKWEAISALSSPASNWLPV